MRLADNMPAYTRHFWAKAQSYRQRGPERIHLLEHHLADQLYPASEPSVRGPADYRHR